MLKVTDELKKTIKSKYQLSDYIKSNTKYEISGSGNLRRCKCPFHDEATAGNSFTIRDDAGTYKCYSLKCGESGDIIEFDMKYNKRTFVESLLYLAKLAGVDLSKYEATLSDHAQYTNRLYAVMREFITRCKAATLKSGGIVHITARGVTKELADELDVICPMAEYPNVLMSMRNDGFNDKDISVLELDKGMIFNKSVIFTIHDQYGNPRSFMSRTLTDRTAKYMSTSKNTPVYSDQAMFGMHRAKKYMGDDNHLIIVEGPFDAAVLASYGVGNAIAGMGTSMRKDSIENLVSMGAERLTMVFDSDISPADVSSPIFDKFDDMIDVCSMPDSLDPDEYIKKHGADAFNMIVSAAKPPSVHLVDGILGSTIINDPHSIRTINMIKKCSKIVSRAKEPFKELIIDRICSKTNISKGKICDLISRHLSNEDILCNYDLELAVIGAMLSGDDKLIYETISHISKPEDVYDPELNKIWVTILRLHSTGTKLNKFTVCNADQTLTPIIDAEFNDSVYGMSDIAFAASTLAALSAKRSLKNAMSKAMLKLHSKNESYANIVDSIMSSTIAKNNPEISTERSLEEILQSIQKKLLSPNSLDGFSLGESWHNLTRCLRGIIPGKLIVISALQSVGKSMLAINWMTELGVNQNVPCLFVSYEMGVHEVLKRMISNVSKIEDERMSFGLINGDEYKTVTESMKALQNGNIHVVQGCGMTPTDLMSTVKYYVMKYGVKVVFVDYIQLMPSMPEDKFQPHHKQLHSISTLLKNVAVKCDVAMVALSQLNREAYTSDLQSARHVSESFGIAQDADVFLILQNKSQDQLSTFGPDRGDMLLILDKVRYSRQGVLLHVASNKAKAKMVEACTEMETI